MTFNIGDRVWWRVTAHNTAGGAVAEIEGSSVGIQPDDDSDLLYLDGRQLFQEIPADDGIYSGIDDISYHADRGSLSSSGARKLLKSPNKFNWAMSQPPETAVHFDIGKFVHAKVLGVGEPVVIIDAENYSTKAARAERDAAHAEGKIPILKAVAEEATRMAEEVLKHPGAAQLLEEGTPELSAYWHDLATKVRLRARFDKLREFSNGRRPIVLDLKTTTNGDPDEFGWTAEKFGLHIQLAWYVAAVRAIGIHDDALFVFINVEKEPPYQVSLTRLTVNAIGLGEREMRRAIDLYAECKAADHWPDYGNEIHTVDLPQRAYYREEART